MPKPTIRQALLHQRRHLSVDTCLTDSLCIQQRLLELPEFSSAGSLALYSPVLNEVFTQEVFAVARTHGKRVAYPRVLAGAIEFVAVEDQGELVSGTFGIPEPQGSVTLEVAQLDLLVVPGVAFDGEGYRLGYGKGFYDRALQGHNRPRCLVGLCFEFQLLPVLPAEIHDVRMDLVLTEVRTIDFR